MSFFKLRNNTGFPAEKNICFLNASLQALHSLDFCRKFFVDREYALEDFRFPICDEISRIFKFSSTQFVSSAGTLRSLIGSLEEGSYSYYNDGSQQDSCAFLQLLLNIIDSEIFSVTGKKSKFLDEFLSKQIISHNFTASQDGSCPRCGSPAYSREDNFNGMSVMIMFMKKETMKMFSLMTIICIYIKRKLLTKIMTKQSLKRVNKLN